MDLLLDFLICEYIGLVEKETAEENKNTQNIWHKTKLLLQTSAKWKSEKDPKDDLGNYTLVSFTSIPGNMWSNLH